MFWIAKAALRYSRRTARLRSRSKTKCRFFDPESGAFYVLDRKSGTWFWIDFEDEQYGGYSVSDFDLLVRKYDFLSLVERPGLLRANPGWLLEPGRPAELAHSSK